MGRLLSCPLGRGPRNSAKRILSMLYLTCITKTSRFAPSQTAEHLTAANLGKSTAPALPLPTTASESATSSYAEALIKKQEERQKIPKGDRANSTFKEDVDVPEQFRAKLEDYFRSGYDRGHMVCCAIMHEVVATNSGYCRQVPAADAKRSQVSRRQPPHKSPVTDAIFRKQWMRLSF